MTQRERSRQARRKWQKLISEQGRSGQSVAAFCRERGLCAPHFTVEEAAAGGGVGKVRSGSAGEIRGSETGAGRAGSGERAAGCGCGRVSRAAGDGRVEILLKNGRSLRVGPGFDAELVRALVAVVESAA